MGVGIIALALWLLYGLDFRINEIMLFPPIVAYTLLLMGLIIVYEKTKQRGLIVSMILPVINIAFCLLGYEGNIIINAFEILLLYVIFESIYKIAIEYSKINKYKKYYQFYLIIQLIILIIAVMNEQILLSIETYLLFVLEVLIMLIIYHLVKINQLLEEDYEEVDFHIPSYSKKHYVIISLIAILCVGCIIIVEDDYVKTVNKEMIHVEELYYMIDKEEYKVIPFGCEVHKTAGVSMFEETFYSEIRIFLRDDYLTSLDTIEYRLKNNNQNFYTFKGEYTVYQYDKDDWVFRGYNPFPGYTAVSVEGEDIYKIELLKDLKTEI